jgi:long-chain acyl-CoA synthetase
MTGYRNRPDETREAIRDGWLYTGDIGERDSEGYLYIRDRKKDMILVSGYNVYPREIDEVLYSHPAVLEAVAAGVDDPHRGEAVQALVSLRPGAQGNEEMLLAHCASNLASYKRPSRIFIVDDIPKTAAGKADRKRARALLQASGA